MYVCGGVGWGGSILVGEARVCVGRGRREINIGRKVTEKVRLKEEGKLVRGWEGVEKGTNRRYSCINCSHTSTSI